ncbi:ArsR family transcriptional regulator [Candidatus Micrarchaeota archaeon]|nr:ArsR family transcriptional regulator [Candidatus Micrarchaeota archaeon]
MSEERITLDRKSFEALAGETRVKILKTLLSRRKTLTEISEELSLSISSIKEQLETLESAEFVTKIDDGHKWKYYQLTKKAKDVLEPRELRVMVLLGMSLLALFLAVFFLLPTLMPSASLSNSMVTDKSSAPLASGSLESSYSAPSPVPSTASSLPNQDGSAAIVITATNPNSSDLNYRIVNNDSNYTNRTIVTNSSN